jgi:S-adenosylmethionine uptake transporter
MKSLPAAPALAVMLAVLFGAALDSAIKHLGATNGALMLSFGRYVAGSIFAAGVYALTDRRRIDADMLRFHAGRSVLIVISSTTFFYALTVMPLVEVITIGFLAPLIVPFTAFLILRERPSRESLAAALVGFAGVLVAVSGPPDAHAHPQRAMGVAAALVSVLTYAVSLTLLRVRAGKDGAPLTTLFANVLPALMLAGPALALHPVPPIVEWPWFGFAGAMGAMLWMLMAWAYARAPAANLAPLEYTALIWSAALGWILFAEVPRPQALAGGLIIAAACIGLAWTQQRAARRRASAL